MTPDPGSGSGGTGGDGAAYVACRTECNAELNGVFAAVFFLRYSIEHGWLGAPIRMAIGLAVGSGLLIARSSGAVMRRSEKRSTSSGIA